MSQARAALRVVLAGGLSWLLLVGSISLAMVVPSLELLQGFGGEGRLDYSHRSGFFSPLTRGFIARILGLGSPQPGDSVSSSRARSRASARGTSVEHPFTNDDFERAYEVTSLPFRARTNTTGAKRQSGEPSDCSPVGGTAWYRFRPATDVALFADTFGTPHATSLGIYSGSRIGALSLIGCDTNVLGNAQVGFRAQAGATYYFQVTGSLQGGPSVFELAAVGPTTVESVSPSGGPADGGSFDHPDISADGRYVAFASYARNLAESAPECPDGDVCETVYLRDRLTGKTIAVASQGSTLPKDDWSGLPMAPSLSADGRYLSFSGWGAPAFGFTDRPGDADPTAFSTYLYDRVTGHTELVSRNSAGEPARSDPVNNYAYAGFLPAGSLRSSVSADGRYVVFNSDATNLGAPVERGKLNTYVKDRVTGTTRLISTNESGQPNDADNSAGMGRNLSHDGRYVAYTSTLGTGTESAEPAGFVYLIYIWDSLTGRSRLVSKLPPGVRPQTGGPAGNFTVGISLDGSHLGFVSRDALVPEDTNATPDVYVYEAATGRPKRVSVTSAGEQTVDPGTEGDDTTGTFKRAVTLSADGRFAAFDSAAPNLAPGAAGSTGRAGTRPPGPRQIYLHDLVTSATTLVSVSSTGEPLPGESILPYISPDASAVTFMHVDDSGRLEVMVHELSIWR